MVVTEDNYSKLMQWRGGENHGTQKNLEGTGINFTTLTLELKNLPLITGYLSLRLEDHWKRVNIGLFWRMQCYNLTKNQNLPEPR